MGLAACQKGLSVGFITAAALVHELIEARDDKRLLRLQRQLAAYKLLIIDELGYVPLSTTGAELLFEVFRDHRAQDQQVPPCHVQRLGRISAAGAIASIGRAEAETPDTRHGERGPYRASWKRCSVRIAPASLGRC